MVTTAAKGVTLPASRALTKGRFKKLARRVLTFASRPTAKPAARVGKAAACSRLTLPLNANSR